MNILSLSIDKTLLIPGSKASERSAYYGEGVESYTAIVASEQSITISPGTHVVVHGSGGIFKITQLYRMYRKARQVLRDTEINVVTSQDPYYVGLLGFFISRMYTAGLEVQIHGFESYSGLRKCIARYVIKKADGIRVVSERLKREVITEFSLAEDRITVVPVYTEIPPVTCPAKNHTNFTFISVSRLVPIKDINLQLEALRDVIKTYPSVKLIIVGDGPLKKNLSERAKGLGIGHNVLFAGYQTDVSEWYCKADALLLTSKREGWGMVVVEAAAHGLPSIMTDVGCAGEFIRTGKNGIVIPVGDIKELVRAMEYMISSPQEVMRLGKTAQVSLAQLPTREETQARYRAGWEKCIDA